MVTKLILLLVTVTLGQTVQSFTKVDVTEWQIWKISHGKEYSSMVEDDLRMKIYFENKAQLSRHNLLAVRGYHGFQQKMNKFGDLLPSEFVRQRNGFLGSQNRSRALVSATLLPGVPELMRKLPRQMDWRRYGVVTGVKDQGQCGSCYTFATTGALEGAYARKTGRLVSLSEQQIVDCSKDFDNYGCNGGTMDSSFEYIKEQGGIDSESSYPYTAREGTCHYSPKWRVAGDVGFHDIPYGNEHALQHAVAHHGPVAVAIDASHRSLQFYNGGVYSEQRCSKVELDHAVLVVGYGEEATASTWWNKRVQKYWIIKNSWGADWGDGGYFKLERGANMCGVATMASFPKV